MADDIKCTYILKYYSFLGIFFAFISNDACIIGQFKLDKA